MRISKQIETRLDIASVEQLFVPDYEAMLIESLQKKFVGTCFKSMYIQSIDKIIHRSELSCMPNSLSGGMYVDVAFLATGLVYETGDIIPDFHVTKITDNNVIIGQNETSVIKLQTTSSSNIFKVDDVVPVIVKLVRMPPHSDKIIISATPFIPTPAPKIVFHVTDPDDIKYADMSKEIKDAQKLLEKCNKKAVKQFIELIYPYKKTIAVKGKKLSLADFGKVKPGDHVLLADRRLDDESYYLLSNDLEKDQTFKEYAVINIPANELERRLHVAYLKSLETIISMVNTYTQELMKQNQAYWKLFITMKK